MNCKEKLLEVRDLHNLFTQPSARYVINILFFNWTYIVCGIAVSVICVLILTKVQKNTENSK